MAEERGRSRSPVSFKQRVRQRKKAMGIAVSPSPEPDQPLEEGATELYRMPNRLVSLHPGNLVKKSGNFIYVEEADALRIAESAGIPVPHVHSVEAPAEGRRCITMQYIEGDTLETVWKDLSTEAKQGIARQLREILQTMRSTPPPEAYVGACAGDEIRDARSIFTHTAPAAKDVQGFVDYLMGSLHDKMPAPLRRAFFGRLQAWTQQRVVLTHGDLAPRNIMVKDGKVVALIDWEEAGWYPECWEYIKFFQRVGTNSGDWRDYADEIFPTSYPNELVDWYAMSRWMRQ